MKLWNDILGQCWLNDICKCHYIEMTWMKNKWNEMIEKSDEIMNNKNDEYDNELTDNWGWH